ncbi:MAG: PAS domain S-box protein, partial [Ilumatobacteraceae bacterium]
MDDWQVDELAVTIIDHIADMVVVLDRRGTIRYANARSEEILGVLRTDWIGRPVFELVHPDDLALAMELLVSTQAAGSGVKEPVPFRVRKGDGSWATVEVITSNIELVDGELALALSGREITRRRPSIEIVNEASERLSRMFADAAIGMTQTGLDGRLLRVNRSFADLLDMEPGELVGRTDAEFTHPDDRAGDRWLATRLSTGDLPTYRSSKRYVTADGRVVYVEVTASLVRDRHGIPLYCATQVVDVTALEEA